MLSAPPSLLRLRRLLFLFAHAYAFVCRRGVWPCCVADWTALAPPAPRQAGPRRVTLVDCAALRARALEQLRAERMRMRMRLCFSTRRAPTRNSTLDTRHSKCNAMNASTRWLALQRARGNRTGQRRQQSHAASGLERNQASSDWSAPCCACLKLTDSVRKK